MVNISLMELFNQNVLAILEQRKDSIQWLADEIGWQRPNLSRMLRGRSAAPRLDTVEEIAEALGESTVDLLTKDFSIHVKVA